MVVIGAQADPQPQGIGVGSGASSLRTACWARDYADCLIPVDYPLCGQAMQHLSTNLSLASKFSKCRHALGFRRGRWAKRATKLPKTRNFSPIYRGCCINRPLDSTPRPGNWPALQAARFVTDRPCRARSNNSETNHRDTEAQRIQSYNVTIDRVILFPFSSLLCASVVHGHFRSRRRTRHAPRRAFRRGAVGTVDPHSVSVFSDSKGCVFEDSTHPGF
jgi:hypothetical protein